jgi:ferrochelatase
MAKKAVLLLNLGSPGSTEVSDVRKYLNEFLMDERVLDIPHALRRMIVSLFILPTRPKKSAEAYASIWGEDGSPLIAVSKQFRDLLADKVECGVYLGMRYGNPSTLSQVEAMKAAGVEEVFIIPLYPHYAMSSYETALVCATDTIVEHAPDMRYRVLNPFYNDSEYIDCLIDQSSTHLEGDFDHVLFSFHGIPERHLTKSDPSHKHCLSSGSCCDNAHPAHSTCYRHQCLQTVREFVAKAGLKPEQYSVSFQSRLGRDPWLRPYTDQTLEELPERGIKKLLVMCPAFVTDCLETLEEISEEGKEIFLEAGGETFEQIPCLNLNEKWVEFVAGKTRSFLASEPLPTALV